MSRPLSAIRRRLPPVRASVTTVSRPLPAMRSRLPPARALVTTLSRPLPTMRELLSTAWPLLPTVSGPLSSRRALHQAVRTPQGATISSLFSLSKRRGVVILSERAARARAKDLLAVGPHEREVLRIWGYRRDGPAGVRRSG